ncbi:trypco2 family protein [Actinoplanes sp. NPDC051513]|uniref:trypco2 family protein n=1 Tax=Actinoplanes sp. NPDC051513 TaxID=3363908 RepID=UPI003798DD2F
MAEIGLADAIRALRSELAESMVDADGQPVRFRLGTVDIEFQVAVAEALEGKADVKFWVVNAGLKATDTSTTTHTVKLQLHPAMADGSEVWTGDQVAEVPN